MLGAAALAGLVVFAVPVAAQTLRNADGPAEAPPASYTASQYVDSRGCVFVRAGLGGKVTWVPRVTRERRLMCGQTPSLAAAGAAGAAAAAAAEPPAEPAEAAILPQGAGAAAVRKAASPEAPAGAGTGAPAHADHPATSPASGRPPGRRAAGSVAAAGSAPPVTLVSAEAVPGSATPCVNAPRIAQRFVLSDGRRFVRCGAPVQDPVAYLNRLGLPGLAVAGAAPAKLPRGYVRAWSDGRLNPDRGPKTEEGDAQMAASWSGTVPMRMKPGARIGAPRPDGARFVQVGAYARAAYAEQAAARLAAAGLAAARASASSGGRPVTLVLAGPFAEGELGRALDAVRAAGFGDAYVLPAAPAP